MPMEYAKTHTHEDGCEAISICSSSINSDQDDDEASSHLLIAPQPSQCLWHTIHQLLLLVGLLPLLLLVGITLTDVWFSFSDVATPTYSREKSWLALHYAKATYCRIEHITQWNCGSTCAEVLAHFVPYRIYDNTSWSTLAFSGVDVVAQRIVVAFRGTSNLANWIENVQVEWSNYTELQPHLATQYGLQHTSSSTTTTTCVGCMVHTGFYKVYDSLRGYLLKDVAVLQQTYPHYEVLITGHSLGGAVAVLCAMDLLTAWLHDPPMVEQTWWGRRKHGIPHVDLITFGAPRLGNLAFASWVAEMINNTSATSSRVVHRRDIVPHILPLAYGYQHSPHEVWEDPVFNTSVKLEDEEVPLEPDTSSDNNNNNFNNYNNAKSDDDKVLWQLCQDNATMESTNCSNLLWSYSVYDHTWYSGTCTVCSCTPEEMRANNILPE